MPTLPTPRQDSEPAPGWIAVVRKAAGSLRYGFIQIKIHDGDVVQIEATEKYRLDDFSPDSDSPPTARAEAYKTHPSYPGPTGRLADLPRS